MEPQPEKLENLFGQVLRVVDNPSSSVPIEIEEWDDGVSDAAHRTEEAGIRTPAKRSRQVEQLYDAARERDPVERAAFLEQACGGDERLRREVESLLAEDDGLRSFLETPALAVAQKMSEEYPSQSIIGRRIGSYAVLSLLAKGFANASARSSFFSNAFLSTSGRTRRSLPFKYSTSNATKMHCRWRKSRTRKFGRPDSSTQAISPPITASQRADSHRSAARYP